MYDFSTVLKENSGTIFYVTLAPVLGLDKEAVIPKMKQQKPVLGDLTKVSELLSGGVGTHTQAFHSQVWHLTIKTSNKSNAVRVQYDHFPFLEY